MYSPSPLLTRVEQVARERRAMSPSTGMGGEDEIERNSSDEAGKFAEKNPVLDATGDI
jgi:hypothetical protein